ncbi:MAG: twitching motility protein PilT [Defluviitaleaceae bacterium]|nr:twitching motility protein PilT [Defluviitaleaceae bacterium]
MIKFIAGKKGEGKTKKLIDMANNAIKTTSGHIVFIDDDSRQMFEIGRDIRFVSTENFPLSNYREFIGFVYGILSQNGDIVEIFVDGLTNIIKTLENEDLVKLVNKLDRISKDNGVEFVISMNSTPEELPEEVRALII